MNRGWLVVSGSWSLSQDASGPLDEPVDLVPPPAVEVVRDKELCPFFDLEAAPGDPVLGLVQRNEIREALRHRVGDIRRSHGWQRRHRGRMRGSRGVGLVARLALPQPA